jgi:CO/xanthine dehydrogenase FAD-binding subunit
MKSALSQMEVVRPKSLDGALRALAARGAKERPVPLAGGTDLFVYLNAGDDVGRRFLDIASLRSLRGIRVTRKSASIGAMTSFTEIREHPALRRRFPSLVAAAAVVGARQIQNRATIGGNIANASPAGDSLPVLLTLDAVVRVRSLKRRREVPLEEFFLDYRKLDLEPEELIVSVAIPSPPSRAFQFFRKVGTRRAQSISKVVFGGVLRLDGKRRVDHVRIAYGSVAPIPLRARHAEEILEGAKPSRAVSQEALAALEGDITPIDDIRSDREYRMAIAQNVLAQFLRSADPRFARD